MIAHNGDQFDHFVLEKELMRLSLANSLNLMLHRFDPVVTLKKHFGQEYGFGGQLRLKALHEQYCGKADGLLQEHDALRDCFMLIEICSHWPQLASLLSQDIATAIFKDTEEAAEAQRYLSLRFACPAHEAMRESEALQSAQLLTNPQMGQGSSFQSSQLSSQLHSTPQMASEYDDYNGGVCGGTGNYYNNGDMRDHNGGDMRADASFSWRADAAEFVPGVSWSAPAQFAPQGGDNFDETRDRAQWPAPCNNDRAEDTWSFSVLVPSLG
jgi:hypothetical protein